MKFKKVQILCLLTLMLFTFSSTFARVSATTVAATDTIVVGTSDKVTKLDPADAYDYFSSNVLVQITHGLMEMPVGSTDAVQGPIVSWYNVSVDAKIYFFNLKSGIQFSDGSAFNATALKWNLDRAITLGGDPGFLLSDVISTVEVINNTLAKITLSSSDATFLQRLTYTVAWPVSPNGPLAVDTISGDPDHIPFGLGPYKITTWTKDTEMILEPNTYYFGDAPANAKVIIKFYSTASTLLAALESGEADVAHRIFGPDEIDAVKTNPSVNWASKDTAGIRYMLFNVDIETEVEVRRAVAAAIDRLELTTVVFNNLNDPLLSMVPSIFSSQIDAFDDGPNEDWVAGNMTAAGYNTTKDGKYKIDFWYTPSHYGSTEADVAQLVEAQLEATGYFEVTLEAAEWSTYLGQLGTMNMFLLGWWFDYPDPSNYIDPFVGAGAVSMGTNYSTSEMDDYIDTMLTNTDTAERATATEDAQKLIAVDVPCIPLFTMLSQFIAYQPNVEGVVLEPSENIHYNSIVLAEVTTTTTTTPTTTTTTAATTTTEEDGAPGFELVTALLTMVIMGSLVVGLKRKRK